MLNGCNHQNGAKGEGCICPASAPSKDFVGSWDWGKCTIVCVKSSLLDREDYVSRPGPGLVSLPPGALRVRSQ